jgi:hypothetical protein
MPKIDLVSVSFSEFSIIPINRNNEVSRLVSKFSKQKVYYVTTLDIKSRLI